MIFSIFISSLAVAISLIIQFASPFTQHVLLRRLLAAPALLLPIFIEGKDHISTWINLAKPQATLFTAFIFSVIALLVNYFHSSSKSHQAIYPQLSLTDWQPGMYMMNIASWVIYLLAYEALFRGYFFFECLTILPLWLTVVVNVIVYSAAHLPKGQKETLLSIPFGVLLCLLTIYTESFWAAAIIHIALALTNDCFAIRANPSMKIHFLSLKN